MASDRKQQQRAAWGGIAGTLVVAAAYSAPAAAFDILLDFSLDTSGFFADAGKRSVVDAAASFFERYILDDLLAIDSSGSNHFNASFTNPSDGSTDTISDFDVAADTIKVFVGARALSGSTLASAGPGGYGVSGSSTFVTNAITRGETLDESGVRGPDAYDFAPWGGSISFNSAYSSWYVDTDPSTDEAFSGKSDLYSVALHELGHVLGIGIADSWDNKIDNLGRFFGYSSVDVYGGRVPLTGDGGHWANGTMSKVYGTNVDQEAAMDPSITVGTRKRFTTLDMAGLKDIGWEVAPASKH